MLAGVARSGSATWQGNASNFEPPSPRQPPSPENLAKPAVKLPSSNFIADYGGSNFRGPFKATIEQGRVNVVAQLPQGFTGYAAERYPTGEMYVGEFVDARREGRGTYSDYEGQLLSYFQAGDPRYEGARVMADPETQKVKDLLRTHDGRTDDHISRDEARAIVGAIGLPLPEGRVGAATRKMGREEMLGLGQGATPPAGSRARAAPSIFGEAAAPAPAAPDFLSRLAAVEVREDARQASELSEFTAFDVELHGTDRTPPAAAAAPPPARSPAKSPTRAAGRRSMRGGDAGAAGRKPRKERSAETMAAVA
jgi:hypothetical protein